MTSDADAPRLRAYLHYNRPDGRPVIWAKTAEWRSLGLQPGDEIEVELETFKNTALGRVASDATVLAVTAQQSSTATGRVTVMRHDPADEKPLNVDHYGVWPDLRSNSKLSDWVRASSTSMNENMERFLDKNMAFVKEAPAEDHHQALPSSLRARLEKLKE